MSEALVVRRPQARTGTAHPPAAPEVQPPAPVPGAGLGASAWSAGAAPAVSLGGVQRMPVLGRPGDAYEQEADAVADRVASGLDAPAAGVTRLGAGGPAAPPQPAAPVQRAEMPDDEEPVQLAEMEDDAASVQLAEMEDEAESVQLAEMEDDADSVQLAEMEDEAESVQLAEIEDEAGAIQLAEMEDESESIQLAEEDEEPAGAVQMAADKQFGSAGSPSDDEKDCGCGGTCANCGGVQRSASGGAAPAPSMQQAAATAIASPGAGAPLPGATRGSLETRMGVDLGGVRVHDGPDARKSAGQMHARAFTHGRHIWLGRGESAGDVRLMAHEVTHVLQQDGVVRRKPLDRKDPSSEDGSTATPEPTPPASPASASADKLAAPALPAVLSAAPAGTAEASASSSAASASASPAPASASAPSPSALPATDAAAAPVAVDAVEPADVGAAEGAAGGEAAPRAAAGGGGAADAAAAGGGGAGAPVELLMPEPPAGLSAEEKARLDAVDARAGQAVEATTEMPAAEEQVGEARAAVQEPEAETQARASDALVEALGERPAPSPEIEALCVQIRTVIHAKRPPDEDALVEAKPQEMAKDAGGQLNENVEGDAERLQGQYDQLGTAPAGEPQQQAEPMAEPPGPAQAPPLDAAAAAPGGVEPEAVSLDADVAASQQRMADAGMESEPAQLVQTGPVAEARAAQGELAETAARDPQEVLAEQRGVLAGAQADMAGLQAAALAALQGGRKDTASGGRAQQEGMVGSEAQMRTQAASDAKAVFDDAQTRVGTLLDPLPRTAMARWDAGVQLLSTEFEQRLARVKRWVDERHESTALAVWDAVTGMPDWVTDEYDRAEREFGDGVCDLIREISAEVNGIIASAEAIIDQARTDIDAVFAALPAELQSWAAEQQAQFGERLNGLAEKAQNTRDDFTRDLAQKASQAVQEVREKIHSLREAAKGLIGRLADAVTAFLDDPAKFIIDGLLSLVGIAPSAFWALVGRIGDAIDSIADDPLGFANNLMAALGQGFQQFFDNIGTHLLQGLMDWLFSGLGSVGVQIPTDTSLKSIVTFFLQLMGLSWANIRRILAKHVGEENVALIEKAWELISSLIEMGPEGLFELIKEQLDPANLLSMVLEAATEYLIEALISAVTPRILLLFNPAGAILQAIEAIFRVLQWIFQNAARIFSLVETIVNGVTDLIAGNIGGMAAAVEGALAKLIPPVIDFLAGYLGLGGLPEAIADVIKGFQQRVLGIVDRIIGFLADKAKGLLKKLGLGGPDDEEEAPAGYDGVIGEPVAFTSEGEAHRIFIATQGTQATVMMASTPAPVDTRWDVYRTEAAKLPKQEEADVRGRIDQGAGLLSALEGTADELAKKLADPSTKPEEKKALDDRIEGLEQQLAVKIAEIRKELKLVGTDEDLSPPEEALLRRIRGGPAVLDKLSKVSPDKRKSLIQESRVALDALARGEQVIEIGRDVFRTGKKVAELLTEIDVETENEIIQVKGGNYAKEKKLSGADMRQLTETKRYNEQHRFGPTGAKLPPKTVVWQFVRTPVAPELVSWLTGKGVVVRAAGV